ncbi:hypothetical protein HAQ04_25545 [Pseudomonas sp. C2L11]|nr:hypothetical protein [Pseudomonas typographi]
MAPLLGRGFQYDIEIVDAFGEVIQRGREFNRIPQVGLDFVANLLLGETTPISTWYCGLFEGNYVPVSSTTAADLPGSAQESTVYSQTARPSWQGVYDGIQLITNTASRAEFTFTSAKTIYGGFLISTSDKGSNTGTLMSIARFENPREVPANTTFRLGITLTLLAASS